MNDGTFVPAAIASELLRAEEGEGHRPRLSAADAAKVHRFVARRVANVADAADIAQQTLLVACARGGTCRGENFSAWLFTIARHQIVDHYRAQNRVQFVEVGALAETEPALQTRPDAARLWECRERLREWLDCITHRLRPEEQVAVLLADVYGHRDKHSAGFLRMSVPCFKLLLHGARARLREIARGNPILVRKTNAAACDDAGNGHGSKRAVRANGAPPSAYPTYRVGVTCRLGVPELLTLRNRMVEGLGL